MSGSTSTRLKPVIPAMRALLYAAAALVLPLSVLIFIPERTDTLAAWPIKPPITAAFFGASYVAGFFLEFLSARENIWANARVAIPSIFLFAVLALVATVMHLDRFHFNHPLAFTRFLAWLWLVAYAVFPVAMPIIFVLQTRASGIDPPRTAALPRWFSLALAVQGGILILTGVLLFVLPATMGRVWPWELTPLTARVIGAWAIGIGAVAVQSIWENDWRRLRSMTVAYTIFGALQLVNVFHFAGSVVWSGAGSWLFVIVMASIALAGGYGWWRSRIGPANRPS